MLGRRTTRLGAALVGVALATTLAAACGSGDDDDTADDAGGAAGDAGGDTAADAGGDAAPFQGEGDFVLWALEDNALNGVEQASIDRFNEGSEAGSGELQVFGNDPYKERLRVAIASPNAPDVFFGWGGGGLNEYVQAGEVVDLTPGLEANPEFRDSFLPSVLAGAELDGKNYGIPMRGMQPVVLYYNTQVFEEQGVEPPETLDDLNELVDVFTEAGITPIALAGSQAWTELMWAEYYLDRIAGPEVFIDIRNGNTEAWNSPEVVDAMSRLQDLVEAGAFGDDFSSVGYDAGGTTALLAEGRAAMHLMGTWEYSNQLNENPDFVNSGGLGYVAFPAVEGGAGDPSNLVGNVSNFYSIAADSESQETAWNYLLEEMSSDEYVDALIEVGDVPAVAGIEDKLAETDNADHAVWVYTLAQDAEHFQLSWDQDLPAAQAGLMLEQLQQLFLGNITAEQFAETLATS
jgi:raffinose/stachyose/melibiose transport system substrate-binding protein/xylobiose transport system substrate-binding protein